jgi:hypothetical protein
MTRRFTMRKYRPTFEALEPKQLQSAGLSTYGATAIARPADPAPPRGASVQTLELGTGKGGVIITS